MATEKLAEGIRKFYADARKLEQYAQASNREGDGLKGYRLLSGRMVSGNNGSNYRSRHAIRD